MKFREQFSDVQTLRHSIKTNPAALGWTQETPLRWRTPLGQAIDFLPEWPQDVWVLPELAPQ